MRPTVKLWEIISFQNWFAFKSENYKNSWAFVMRIKNVQDWYISLEDPQYIGLEDIDLYKDFLLDAWDILMSLTWNIWRVWIIKSEHLPALLNQRVARLKITEWIDNDFVFYFLSRKSFQEWLMSIASWAAQKNISVKDIQNFEIPLPPLETQKTIVAKLDQIFAELDQTKSEIQKNLDNTDELWKSALNQAFQGDWEMKKLGEVATVQAWWTPSKEKKEYWENWDIPRLRSECCKNKSIYEAKEFISQSWFEHSSAKLLKKWTTLIALVWATIWKIAYLEFEATTNQNIAWIYPNDKNLDTKYLFNACLTLYKYFEKRWEWKFAMANLSFVKDLQIPVPPLSEQEKIVEHLDQVSKEVKALKSQYQSQLDNLEELKKSVLDKAFRWELGE